MHLGTLYGAVKASRPVYSHMKIRVKKTVWPRSDVKIVDKIGEGFYADVFLVREKKSGGKVELLYFFFLIPSPNLELKFRERISELNLVSITTQNNSM